MEEYISRFDAAEIDNRLDAVSKKAGCFYHDVANNRYLVFADDATRDKYLETFDTSLIIGTFTSSDNTGDFGAEIYLNTPMYNAVFLGSTGNIIDFTFDVKNKQGVSTGEDVLITFTITRGANRTEIKQTKHFGQKVLFNADRYLGEGTNTISITVLGQTSLSAITVAVTFEVINLTLIDHLDISKVYNLSKGAIDYLEIPYDVSGSYTKLMEWFIDGQQLEFVRNEDEILETTPVSRVKTIELSNLSHGIHNVQFRVGTRVNGELFYSDILYRDFFVNTGLNDHVMIGVAINIPAKYGIVNSENSLAIYDMMQYVSYDLKLASYSPINIAKTEIGVYLDDSLMATVVSTNGAASTIPITPITDGNKTLKLIAVEVELENEIEYTISVTIAPTTMNLTEITEKLILNFNANGRSNNSPNRAEWSYKNITGTLTGFKWNNNSGWVNDRLEFDEDTELHINYSPLENHDNGKTIEMEWKTKNVSNENAVICDLRDENGTGILITATGVYVVSSNKAELIEKYKSEEEVRISIVINHPTRGANKGLTFIYTNGKISRAINILEGDYYTNNKELIIKGSSEAGVSLKSILVYDMALTTDQIFNNFNLYRNTLSEMFEVYDRNDIYDGNLISTTKMATRLPVMIITGDIPVLENTNDKDTQIIVDIEYINMQDTTLNFEMIEAAMRPQGTSSMGYPKKNFRLYTRKVENTILKVNGKVVENKLYAFKRNSIPVDCWCLKADFAESSGTHNVGNARLWGEAFKNARVTCDLGEGNPHNVSEATVLRTKAQQAAIDNNYNYDVRTTIDGFPILLFYRPTKNDDIIFIGKYNFNNDKSTEAVFGFKDIPGFDNTNVQCWEFLNNGNHIGLFTNISQFYENVVSDGKMKKGWELAFESRYPDTKTPDTTNLYNFATWINGINGNHTRFAQEKWEHIDVYKTAGCYCYLNRHGAADQWVKNAMLTTEDGIHFFFILYDNDTTNGLINTGAIGIEPTDNRDSVNPDGSYKFAGHESVLWNMLEADEEFQIVVRAVDNALYTEDISYGAAIDMYDNQLADKWVEKVYNLDAQYKYIGPYVNNGINNLFMLQGKRELHRKWWLSNRYSLYDSLYVSGAYKSGYVEIKCIETKTPQTFNVTSGYPIYYGYGINGNLRERSETPIQPNNEITFNIKEEINLGDPIAIYGAPHIKKLDFSSMMDRIAVFQMAGIHDKDLGTKLETLIIGSPNKINNTFTEVSGIKNALALTHLDVTNCQGLTSIDLSANTYLQELKAIGTNIAGITLAQGAPINKLVLPNTFKQINFDSLPFLTAEGLQLEDSTSVESIKIINCPNLSNDFSWVYIWYLTKKVSNDKAKFEMDNIAWENVDYAQLLELANIKNLTLKGKVKLIEGSQEIIDAVKAVFGDTVFNKTSDFYVSAPDGVYLSGPSKLLEGESVRYVCAAFSDENGKIMFSIPTIREGCSIDSVSGVLTTTENGLATSDIVVRAVFITDSGKVTDTTMNVTIEQRSYPTEINIEGNSLVSEEISTFTLSTTPAEITGLYRIDWVLGDASAEYLTIEKSDNTTCVIKRIKEGVVDTTLTATMIKLVDGSTVKITTKNISLVLPGVVITKSSNAPLQECLYNNGLVAHEDYSEAWELALITANQLQPETSDYSSIFYNYSNKILSLDELQYFTGLDKIPNNLCYWLEKVNKISLPKNITLIDKYAFCNCKSLTDVYIPDSVTTINEKAFYGCTKLNSVRLSENLSTLGRSCFENCSNLNNINIPDSLESIDWAPFWGCFTNESPGLVIRDNWVIGFVDSEDITDVVIPEYIIGIAPNSFGHYDTYYDKTLKEKNFVIHSNVRKVYPMSFARCGGTLYYNGPITEQSFFVYSHFKEIVLGEAVTELKYAQLFSKSGSSYVGKVKQNLTKFHIEGYLSVFNYGLTAGGGFTNLKELYIRIGSNCNYGTQLIPSSYVNDYTVTIEGEDTSYIIKGESNSSPFMKSIPHTIVLKNCSIGKYFLYESDGSKHILQNIIFDGNITLYPEAIYGIHKEANINIPNNVTLGVPEDTSDIRSLFSGTFASLSIDVKEIPAYGSGGYNSALVYNGNVPHIYFGENVESIDSYICPTSTKTVKIHFTSLEKFNNIIFGDSVLKYTEIFIGEEQITELEITSDVSRGKFRYCKSLLKVIIKEGVQNIESTAFYGSGVTEITIPESVSIASDAFEQCSFSKMTVPSISKRLAISKYIGDVGVYDLYIGDEKLIHVLLDNTITSLPNYAFCGICSIESFEARHNLTQIASYAFSSCLNLKEIKLHQSNAPTTNSYCFGSGTSSRPGRNTYNTGENMLYVPQGATGYDKGAWLDPLQNADECGFTISYTL